MGDPTGKGMAHVMEKNQTLHFEELDPLDAPLEWWQHVGYIIAAAAGLVAVAT